MEKEKEKENINQNKVIFFTIGCLCGVCKQEATLEEIMPR